MTLDPKREAKYYMLRFHLALKCNFKIFFGLGNNNENFNFFGLIFVHLVLFFIWVKSMI
jgi:hypothetical protein